jgi:hypothetical protein
VREWDSDIQEEDLPEKRSRNGYGADSQSEEETEHEQTPTEVYLDEGETPRQLSIMFCVGCQKTHTTEHR